MTMQNSEKTVIILIASAKLNAEFVLKKSLMYEFVRK